MEPFDAGTKRQPDFPFDPEYSHDHRHGRYAHGGASDDPANPRPIGRGIEDVRGLARLRAWNFRSGFLPHASGLETIEPREQRQRFFGAGAVLDRGRQQPAGGLRFAALKCVRAGVNELFAFALTFGDRAARPLDVRARPRMAAVEEQHPRPDVDGEIVLSGEIVVEAAEKQLFDARFAITLRQLRDGGTWLRTERIGHRAHSGLECDNGRGTESLSVRQ